MREINDWDYIRKEISYALRKEKKFYVVYLEETNLLGELEFDISDIQAVEKYGMNDDEFYKKLRNDLVSSLLD